MTQVWVNLAVEDVLSEAVLRRLLGHCGTFAVHAVNHRGGNGYLLKNIRAWNAAARHIPYLVLTDLDKLPCPSALIDERLPVQRHPNLLFRVAVREVESWLLADANGFASFLAVKPRHIPQNPEDLLDPKRRLIELAASSRNRTIRADIVPRRASTAAYGPGYNNCLGQFVRDHWDIEAASEEAPSLRRTINRLRTFRPV